MHDIRNILRHSYYKNQLEFYSKIVTVSKDTDREQGQWFNFIGCLCSLVFKKKTMEVFLLLGVVYHL